MFNALFGKSSSKTIAVIESTGDECTDEFLLVFLGEKTFNSVISQQNDLSFVFI